MFERIDYVVHSIAGDYAYLIREDQIDVEEKCVARALLPPEIMEGSKLAYVMMEYRICDGKEE